jgi:hypothetical protein
MTAFRKLAVAASLAALCTMAAPSLAAAQVAYDRSTLPLAGLDYPYTDESPYAVAHGERPSFVIVTGPYGYGPGVAVVPRCLYPNGWNVTDFGRDLNGIPPGIEHQCPEPTRYRVRARY